MPLLLRWCHRPGLAGFGSALLGALLLSLVSYALNVLVYDHNRGVFVEVRRF